MTQTQLKEAEVISILVMEDDKNIAKGLKMILTDDGFNVTVAYDGQSALDAFKKQDFDLLIADIRLPDMDGMDVIKQVRRHTPQTKVITITGYVSTSLAVDAMHAGVKDFLPKPFSEEQIRTSIKETLKAHGSTDKNGIYVTTFSETNNLIQKREVLHVLDRTNEDQLFCHDLQKKGTAALAEYALSDEAKDALATGDLNWINKHVGQLTQKQLKYVFSCSKKKDWQL